MAIAMAASRRARRTPYSSRVERDGVKAYTVYNHTLLPTMFRGLREDYEHLCSAVQVWDVSCERQVEINGPDANRLVQWMTPRDISKVAEDRCVYLPLVDETGRLVNDPVGLRLGEDRWWLSLADSDVLLWARGLAHGQDMKVSVHEPDVWPLAVQGPKADELMRRVFGDDVDTIRFFRYKRLPFAGHELIVARSGWSKQGGFEIYVDDVEVGRRLYDQLFADGADLDVGPGCPNLIERIESTLLSFGAETTLNHSPLEAGLESFLTLDADIDAMSLPVLRAERERGIARRIRGLVLDAPDGERPFAADPFVDPSGLAEIDRDPVPVNEPLVNFVGAQVWSHRWKKQLGFAMLDEPLASRATIDLHLADGSTATVQLVDLPLDPASFQ